MWRYAMFVVAGLISGIAQAFLVQPAPIQYVKYPNRRFMLTPRASVSARSIRRPLQLSIRERPAWMPSSMLPRFMRTPDKSITWENGGCLEAEASGDKKSDEVRLNQCTGGPSQKWECLPDSHGRTMIQLQNTNSCLDVSDEDGLDGAPVRLRDCEQVTQSWESLDSVPLPPQSPSQLHESGYSATLSSSSKQLCSLGLLSMLSFGLWRMISTGRMWRRWQANGSAVDASRGDASSKIDQGGVSLTVPFALPRGREVAAAMVIIPIEGDESRKDAIKKDEKNDLTAAAGRVLNGSRRIFQTSESPSELDTPSVPSSSSRKSIRKPDAMWPSEGKFHRFVTSQEARDQGDGNALYVCKTPDKFQGTRKDGVYRGSCRIHFTLPGEVEQSRIIEFLRSQKNDNPAFGAVRVKLPIEADVEEIQSRLVVRSVREESNADLSRIRKGDIIRAVSLPEGAGKGEIPWYLKMVQAPVPDAEEGLVILDGKSYGDFFTVLKENLRLNGDNSEVVLLIERPVNFKSDNNDFDFWSGYPAMQRELAPELVPIPVPVDDNPLLPPRPRS